MVKVLYNIKKLQYVPIESVTPTGTPTYGTPIKLPGTVSLSLDPEGSSSTFHADGIAYYTVSGSTTYKGTLENAMFTQEVLTAVYAYMVDSNQNLVETTGKSKEFGMQFAVDSDDGEVYFTFYRVSSTKPNVNFQTSEDEPQINPQSVEINVSPISTTDGKYQVIKSYADKKAKNYATYFESLAVPSISVVAVAG